MEEKNNTISSKTYDLIKKDIIFGKLKPASKLKLDNLKNNYNASLSTIRETLNRLSSEGFVKAEEQRGFFVNSFTKGDLIEIANLRILLECHAIKLSIDNGDTNWEGNIVAARHKLHLLEKEMQKDYKKFKEEWKKYDLEFHLALVSNCRSSNLLDLHTILYDKYIRYQMAVKEYRGKESEEEHKKIFEAALNRNSKEASETLETHILKELEHTLKIFNN
ncbi:GntR family transcriptional regulator [Pelagibacterales bacterium SAG-MED31]|nr:GntR family transcriptional regulator [Pelagibacterales bacterium SAG-MED31]